MTEAFDMLQWGRSLGSCGNQALGVGPDIQRLASMGPQPWELRKWPSCFILQKSVVAHPVARAHSLEPDERS